MKEESHFLDTDPMGAIRVDENPMAVSIPEQLREFERALEGAGFTQHCCSNPGCWLPPEGDLVRMEDVVEKRVIDAMFDAGYYPEQKTGQL